MHGCQAGRLQVSCRISRFRKKHVPNQRTVVRVAKRRRRSMNDGVKKLDTWGLALIPPPARSDAIDGRASVQRGGCSTPRALAGAISAGLLSSVFGAAV